MLKQTELNLHQAMADVFLDATFTVDDAVNSVGFGRFQIIHTVVTGLCWMADSMEMMILSIISQALHCAWGINSLQQALITTIVFVGMMIGASFWGFAADKYGRKKPLIIASTILFYYGVLSAFSPNFKWILILRFCVGFAIGNAPQAITLYAEYLPSTQRAKCVLFLACFWAVGACFEVSLALFIMPTLGWRWLLGVSSLPVLFFILAATWLPESARYLAASGKSDAAVDTLKRVAKMNGKVLPQGRFITDDLTGVKRGRLIDLLIPELRRTTILLWFLWVICAFCYYGVVLITAEYFRLRDRCSTSIGASDQQCQLGCVSLKSPDYVNMLYTTFGEFPGYFITALFIDRFGRKKALMVDFLTFSVCIGLLLICDLSRTWATIIIFAARAVISGVFPTLYAYTLEIYPTTLRAIGVGTCSGMARIGAMTTPFVSQMLLQKSLSSAIGIYIGFSVLAALGAVFLPFETKGRAMTDAHGQR